MNAKTKEKLGNIAVPEKVLQGIRIQAALRKLKIREYVAPALKQLSEGKMEVAR